jgi:hypothetical protein
VYLCIPWQIEAKTVAARKNPVNEGMIERMNERLNARGSGSHRFSWDGARLCEPQQPPHSKKSPRISKTP